MLLQTATDSVTPWGFVVGYIISNVVPLITAWLVKKYNTSLTWYAKLSNPVKMAVYVGVTVVAMYLFQLIGLGWDKTFDPEHLTPGLIASVIQAIVGTLLVKVGIKTRDEQTQNALEGKYDKPTSGYGVKKPNG